MDVEIIADKAPLGCQRVRSDPALDVFDKILFVACSAGGACDQFASCNIEVTDKRQRTMPDILKFTPFYFAWTHRQVRVFALQRLYAGHFIQAFGVLPLFGSFRGLFVGSVDVCNFLVKACFVSGCQPITAQMWLDIRIFLKASPHGGERCHQLSGAFSLHPQFLGLSIA